MEPSKENYENADPEDGRDARVNPLRRFQVSLGPPCSFEGAPGQRNRMQIAQIALAAALLAKSNAALGGGWAYTDNTACEGDDPTYVEDRNAALDLEALSYKEDGSEECEDISKVETIVVIGTRGGDGGGFSIGSGGGGGTDTQRDGPSFPYGGGGGGGGSEDSDDEEEEEDVVESRTGLCVRPIDLLPPFTPVWISNTLPEHHDVRVEKTSGGIATESTTRGFFAVDMGAAVIAALVWADSVSKGIDTFSGEVPAVVRDSAATAGPCTLESSTDAKYQAVLNSITAPNTKKYHLVLYNCQDWAAEMLGS